MGVSSGCLDFENAIVDGQQRHIESSSSEIIDNNLTLVTSAVKTVCDGGRGWLVHNSNDVQAGNSASILRSLSLIVVEICWNGDHGVHYRLPKIALSDLLHLSEYHGGDFFGGERPILSLDLNRDGGFVILVGDSEREVLDVTLDVFVRELASDQSPAQPCQRTELVTGPVHETYLES